MSRYVIWLEWPEKCFRACGRDMALFRSLVPARSEVKRVRSERAFIKALKTATHAVTWSFKAEWYALAPRLKVVATPAAGRELVAPPPQGTGVKVHFGAYHGEIISESVAAFVLAWARGFFLPEMRSFWPRTEISGKCRTVSGTRAVVAGYGHVGRKIGEKLSALGVEVSGFGRKNLAGLPQAMRSADWFVMALPGTPETENFLDAKKLALLPRRAVVVNVGRGGCVDEEALLAALKSGSIAGAYLDVCKNEPTASFSRRSGKESRIIALARKGTLPANIVLTPHSSAFSPDYIARSFMEMKNEGVV